MITHDFRYGDKVVFSDSRIRKAEKRPLGSSGRMLPTDEFVLKHKDNVFDVYRINHNGHIQLTRDGQIYHQNWQYHSISLYRKPVELPEELFKV